LALYEAIVHLEAITDPKAKKPGNGIDVFLELVIDELVETFETGVKDVWDEYKRNMSRSR
jgi:hypothetical protein